MSYNHNNKLILITGASSGIGYSTAIEFSKKKTKLALVGRSENKLAKLKKAIKDNNLNVEYFVFDLKNLENIEYLIKKIENHFDQSIDIFIHCAGYAVLGNVQKVNIKDYQENININTFSAIVITKNIIEKMKKKKNGQFIFISSGIGKRALPGASSYSISKFALNAFSESLRVELLEFNVDVIVISPGLVSTNFEKNIKLSGNLSELFTSGKKHHSQYVAKKIFKSSLLQKRYVSLSYYSSLGVLINFLFPKFMDYYLNKRINK
tara:strand:- start:364 stop:1158 length:795 start_codon:yes stop_codon:yes gene_type:complete